MNLRNTAALLTLLVMPPALATTAPADAAHLLSVARQFLAGSLPPATADSEREILLSDPDPRLHLKACAEPLVGFWPANARQTGNTVVGVRCGAAGGWQIFLPVRIQDRLTVLVAARPLRPGQRLQAADLKPVRTNRDQLRGTPYGDPAPLIGAVVRQGIATGQPLSAHLICQICKGDPVNITASTDGLDVVMKGVAEGWGNSGDRVAVRNLSSRRTVQAVVITAGQVRVTP